MTRRLISADSHVRVPLDVIRERVPASLHEAFDDAISLQAAEEKRLRGGKELDMSDWDMDAFRDPGYSDPVARLAAMDRDGVQAEVLYSEVSAFRHFGLVKGDWKPISRAFTDHLSEFASVDPKRLAVSYQVPIIDIDYAVTEVHRLTFPPSWACPTTTTRRTTRCGQPSPRPVWPSHITSAPRRISTTCSSGTPRRNVASSRRCPP